MKYLFFVFVIASLFSLQSCGSSNILIADGRSDFKIFVSDSASLTEKFAARELGHYLYEITGYKIPVTHQRDSQQRYIFVGFYEVPESLLSGIEPSAFGKEEYIIRSNSQHLLIAGGEPRGTLYGVIGYLSDHLGCRWYTKEVVKIPERKIIPLPNRDDRQQPAFEYREAWYHEAYDSEWALHNRLNPGMVPVPDSMGGSYISYPFVHSFYQLVSPEKYFKQHPEYFSEVNGKRVGMDAQLCLTNPSVVKIATETVMRWIKEHPEAAIFAVDQNDGYGYCECRECKALDEAEGSHSGTLIHFVNQIAAKVAAVYPDVKLQTLAYAYTEVPPKTIRPADNITIRLCHYNYCSAHKIGGCDSHKPFIERLELWRAVASRITVWDYFTDYNHYLLPFPNFEPVKNDVKFYADHQVKGLFAQGSNMQSEGGSEFSTLRAWVFAQLMWNPDQDGQMLIDEFVKEVYGKASVYISEYIRLLHDQVKPDSVYFSIYADPEEVNYLSVNTVAKADSLFALALQASENDEPLLKRIELAYLPVIYTKLLYYINGGTAYISREEAPKALKWFKRIINEHKITSIAEGPGHGDLAKFISKAELNQEFFTDWWIIGPFDNENGKGLITAFSPERDFNLEKSVTGKNGVELKWEKFNNPASGYIDFTKIFRPSENVVAYARRTIYADHSRQVQFGIGSNDGVRVWINGKLVLDRQLGRRAQVNDDIITVPLKEGENDILIKVDQLKRGWGFYFTEIN